MSARRVAASALALALLWLCAVLWRAPPARVVREGRTIVDERGRTVTVARPLGVRAVDMGIGLGPYLMVARDPAALVSSRSAENERIVASSYLRRALPGLARLRLPLAVGETGSFNLETMLKVHPGIVVTWARLAAAYERIGLPTAGMLPVGSTGRLRENTALYADIVGDAPRGAAIIARARAACAATAAEVAAATRTHPRLLLLLPLGSGRWRVGFGFPDIIAAAGGIDIGASLPPHAFLDDERVVALAPDVIVIIGSPAARLVTPASLMVRPGLAGVPAIRERRVYATPPGVSGHMMTTMELPIEERWLADILHPGEMKPGVAALATQIYAIELGAAPAAAEVDRDLAVAANAGSAGGGR